MDISRDLFPTDGRSPYLTLTLASRDVASHNLLTRLSDDGRQRISEALAAAGIVVLDVLREADARSNEPGGHQSFGCGT